MFHQVVVVGNLGRDPEMRYMPSGRPVTNMNLAANRKYTGSDGQLVKETVWFRVSVFGQQAENCNQYLRKGSQVLVVGRLSPDPATGGPRVWQGQNGPGASYELVAEMVRFLSGKDGGQNGNMGVAVGESDVPPWEEENKASDSWDNWGD